MASLHKGNIASARSRRRPESRKTGKYNRQKRCLCSNEKGCRVFSFTVQAIVFVAIRSAPGVWKQGDCRQPPYVDAPYLDANRWSSAFRLLRHSPKHHPPKHTDAHTPAPLPSRELPSRNKTTRRLLAPAGCHPELTQCRGWSCQKGYCLSDYSAIRR